MIPRTTRLETCRRFSSFFICLLALAGLCLSAAVGSAQTLQFRFSFEDAGATPKSGPDGALGAGMTLTTLNFNGTAQNFLGGAASGVQHTGQALDFSSTVNAGTAANPTINGGVAFTTNDTTLGSLGVVTNFITTIWFKQNTVMTNTLSRGPRVMLLGNNTITDNNGTANDISFYYQTTNALVFKLDNSIISAPLYYNPLPTNVWMFVALEYDGTNASFYFGTEATPAKLVAIQTLANLQVDFGGSANLILGNRLARDRGFSGWIDEVRFYTGAGDANFIESIRQASTPIVVSSLYPDGATLMQGTNTLSFTANSAAGINPSGIKVAVNGADVTSSLVIGGTANSRTVSYTGLSVNPTLVNNTPLNQATVNFSITDVNGIVTTNSINYDSFSTTNFTWEAEDYDYNNGAFIDNPRYAFVQAPDTYFQLSGAAGVDYNDNGNGAPRVYRSPFDLVATEFSYGTGANGGASEGEMMRQKILDAETLDNTVRDVDVGFFDGGTGGGLPNWLNFTRTFPKGSFNIYARMAFGGGGTGGTTLASVTDGWGTPIQTTTNLGTFSTGNTGGWESYQWVPLRDGQGNLLRVDLNGTNTFQLTALAAGGGNVNFLMLTPANTNLPIITGIYPNGTNLLQPSSALTFTVSSPSGVSINTNSIKVQLTATTIFNTSVTNLTATNGLIITGDATNRFVSAPLIFNATYVAVISATDASGNPASTTVTFDTFNPSYVWEAEDFDHDSGLFIDNPQTNGYAGLGGTEGIDSHAGNIGGGQLAYRPDGLNTEVNADQPRLDYIGTGFTDYDVGWNDPNNYGNYTRTYPQGTFNVYMRAANGSGGAGSATFGIVTGGQGTTTQTVTNLGTFAVPATAGWQAYIWSPLRDSSGNLVKITTDGSTNTFRVTSGGGFNANFYALFVANTNLPVLANVQPSGTTMFESTNTLSFTANASAGIATNSISVTVNGVDVSSNLTFAGNSTNRIVSFRHLEPNTIYTVTISVTDTDGNTATTTQTFDTFGPANYTWEAEDYDFNGGQFIDNPAPGAYAGVSVVADVDTHDINTGGGTHFVYRPDGMETEVNGDLIRSQFGNTNDVTVGYYSTGEWMNFTHNYPAGTYNVYGRMAAGGGDTTASLSEVTSGWGTTTQTTNQLGTFNIANTGWESYNFVPLRDNSGNLVQLTLNGSTNTLQLDRPDPSTGLPDLNVNFLMLVPLFEASAAVHGTNMVISFPTQSGFNYQVQFKTNLSDPTWTALGTALPGSNVVESVTDPINTTRRFYSVVIH